MKTVFKTIAYRGGLVSFEIPSHWKEEYEGEGGGTFYENTPSSGTLRLNVMSMTSKEARSPSDVIPKTSDDEVHETLPCGFLMRYYVKNAEDRGTPLHLYRWEIVIPVTPTQYRLACFTHTLLAAQKGTAEAKKELQMINSIVREARFSTALGELQKSPWWRFW